MELLLVLIRQCLPFVAAVPKSVLLIGVSFCWSWGLLSFLEHLCCVGIGSLDPGPGIAEQDSVKALFSKLSEGQTAPQMALYRQNETDAKIRKFDR